MSAVVLSNVKISLMNWILCAVSYLLGVACMFPDFIVLFSGQMNGQNSANTDQSYDPNSSNSRFVKYGRSERNADHLKSHYRPSANDLSPPQISPAGENDVKNTDNQQQYNNRPAMNNYEKFDPSRDQVANAKDLQQYRQDNFVRKPNIPQLK